jgi:glycerate 2-kinase
MRIVIAPAAFKGTLSAREAAAAMALGARDAQPDAEIVEMPMADGGDGTLEVMLGHGYSVLAIDAVDALGRQRTSRIGLSSDSAFIELAEICGIAQLAELDPINASSLGLGLAMRAALNAGVRHLVIAIGGSASTDGGLGMLMALGLSAIDVAGRPVSPDLAGLGRIASIDASGLDPRLSSVTLLTDVDSPLLGPSGAARAFGPQKGLAPDQCAWADDLLARWAELVDPADAFSALPGAGAAGGVGFAALALLGAERRSGASTIGAIIGLDAQVAGADLVLTGEGSFDTSTAAGKAPERVIASARAAGVPVEVISGRAAEGVMSLQQIADSLESAMAEPGRWLREAARQIVTKVAVP